MPKISHRSMLSCGRKKSGSNGFIPRLAAFSSVGPSLTRDAIPLAIGGSIPIEFLHPATGAKYQDASPHHRWFEIEWDKSLADHFAHVQEVNPILALVAHGLLLGFTVERKRLGFRHTNMWRSFRLWIRDVPNAWSGGRRRGSVASRRLRRRRATRENQ